MLWAPVVILALLSANPEPSLNPPNSAAAAVHVAQPSPKSATDAAEEPSAEKEMLQMINASRAKAGLPALRLEPSLSVAARAHADFMVKAGQLEHQLPGEPALMQRIAKVIAIQMDRAGENIAEDSCIEHAHEALMNSPPHRHNLLDGGFNIVGLAAVRSQGRLYVVEDFGHEIRLHTASETRQLVIQAVRNVRKQAGLDPLPAFTPSQLDEAVCGMTEEGHPNARLLQTAFDNRRIITYTQSRPEILPQKALPLIREPGVRQFAVGTCYARTATYPTGIYWIAVLLY